MSLRDLDLLAQQMQREGRMPSLEQLAAAIFAARTSGRWRLTMPMVGSIARRLLPSLGRPGVVSLLVTGRPSLEPLQQRRFDGCVPMMTSVFL